MARNGAPAEQGAILADLAPGASRCDNARPFSNRQARVLMSAAQPDAPFRTFMCVVCGYLYNEAEGWPADGIAPGTRWEDVPETWTCPDCGVTKSDFEMVEV